MRYEFAVDLKSVWRKPPPTPMYPRHKNPPIRRMLVLAYQIREYMTVKNISTLTAFCRRMNITPARASQIMSLLQLSTRIQEQILLENGARLYGLSEYVIRPILKKVIWESQEEMWKESKITKTVRHRHLVNDHMKS